VNAARSPTGWPELDTLVTELRERDCVQLADKLVDAVSYASTSGEIYNNVGATLLAHRAQRKVLSAGGAAAWDKVLDHVDRLYGPARLGDWLARRWRNLWRKT
jgi:hypothetical protein